MKKVWLSGSDDNPGVEITRDLTTEVLGIVAQRGAGKTYTARAVCEAMLELNEHVVVFDPIGVWHGMRSEPNGESGGFPILIGGGAHGDFSISRTNGVQIAKWCLEQKVSMILDLSDLTSDAAMRQFVTDFLNTLYDELRAVRHRMHIFFDEADMFAPQRVDGSQAKMVGAMNKAARRGRARGMGMTFITQRSAVINKDVFSQISTMAVLQLRGTNDRKVVKELIDSWAGKEKTDAVMKDLAALQQGEMFWCKGKEVTRTKANPIKTFDSSRTPGPDELPVMADTKDERFESMGESLKLLLSGEAEADDDDFEDDLEEVIEDAPSKRKTRQSSKRSHPSDRDTAQSVVTSSEPPPWAIDLLNRIAKVEATLQVAGTAFTAGNKVFASEVPQPDAAKEPTLFAPPEPRTEPGPETAKPLQSPLHGTLECKILSVLHTLQIHGVSPDYAVHFAGMAYNSAEQRKFQRTYDSLITDRGLVKPNGELNDRVFDMFPAVRELTSIELATLFADNSYFNPDRQLLLYIAMNGPTQQSMLIRKTTATLSDIDSFKTRMLSRSFIVVRNRATLDLPDQFRQVIQPLCPM